MESLWPQFVIPQPLDGKRAWTASFDSYDQYREWCYYCVRLFDGGHLTGDLIAQVATDWMVGDLTKPGAMEPLYAAVAQIAASGVTNSAWGGCFGRAPEDPFTHLATNPWSAMTITESSTDTGGWILRYARMSDYDIWQVDLVERWTKRVAQTWHSWSRRARSVRWDGDTVIVTNHNGIEERLTPS